MGTLMRAREESLSFFDLPLQEKQRCAVPGLHQELRKLLVVFDHLQPRTLHLRCTEWNATVPRKVLEGVGL